MTFSIVGFDRASKTWGVAVASKFLAVGALVPWGRAGTGAIATQAMANLAYGPDGLDLLSQGNSAKQVIDLLTERDPQSEHRQIGVVDARGGSATFTGAKCMDWAGGVTGQGFAAQGNILVVPDVVDQMAEAFITSPGPLAERLLAALRAGDRAGGDRRGRQSAGLRTWREGAAYGGELDIETDLRVDDHATPVTELVRLLDLHRLYFGTPDPATLLPLVGEIEREVAMYLESLGYEGSLAQALARWAGTENFEERLVMGKIDPLVLEQLRRQAVGSRIAGAAAGRPVASYSAGA